MSIANAAAHFMNELFTKLCNFTKKSEMFIESVKPPGRKCVAGNEDTRKKRLHRAEPQWRHTQHASLHGGCSLRFNVFQFPEGKTRLETLKNPGQRGETLQGNAVPAENSSALVTR